MGVFYCVLFFLSLYTFPPKGALGYEVGGLSCTGYIGERFYGIRFSNFNHPRYIRPDAL